MITCPRSLLFSRLNSPNSQPFLTAEVLQPSDHLCDHPKDSLQQVHVSPVLGAPELDAVLQVGSHHCGAEGQNALPRPTGHAAGDADAARGAVRGAVETEQLIAVSAALLAL